MELTETQISGIVEKIISQLEEAPLKVVSNAAQSGDWLCDSIDHAVESAKRSQRVLMQLSLAQRKKIITAMRDAAIGNANRLGEMACEETGFGRAKHKVMKCILAAEKTPGVEDLEAQAYTGDYGLTLIECAPYGVIGSITPSTNPPSSIINNAIGMVAAGNAVVFNPHPAAKKVSIEAMRVLNEAIFDAGGPQALLCAVRNPDIHSARALMAHRDIPLLSITGGEAVVRAAMRTGKKVIAAGPGNPPVIVDETADIAKAGRDIVDGAGFDNDILCIAEKEIFAVERIADKLIEEMCANGAHRLDRPDIDRVLQTVMAEKDGVYAIDKAYVGKNAGYILEKSGVSFTGDPRLIIAEVEMGHPFVMTEMLMPVMPVVRVADVDTAIDYAIQAEQGYHHSAMMHSTDVNNLSRAAKALNTTIFVKNAPSYAGVGFQGEGHTSFTIATPTGEGLTSARSFTRSRRCVMYGTFRIV
jgi:acyl-CoA reductase-like NAD-dependent aldehyde dehydrogenase